MRAEIEAGLAALEKDHGITVLYAVESGSRAWGFESRDSDWDVRFIYRRPADMYLSIDENYLPVEQRGTINVPITGDLDISGWDVRKALLLLRKSNPTLLEWLSSPVVYRERAEPVLRLRELSRRFCSPRACLLHYLSMARGNFRQYLENREVVARKKYLYAVRPALACLWILERGGPAPMHMGELMTMLDKPSRREAREAIHRLIGEKKGGAELGRGPRDPVIHGFLRELLARIQQEAARAPEAAVRDSEPLNEYLRWVIRV